MTSNDMVLGALRTLGQFQLAETGAQVARAAALGQRAQRQVHALTEHCESTAAELRVVMSRSPLDPALAGAMRRLYQIERRALDDAQARLATAQRQEHQVRTALAVLRNRDRSLERALQAEARTRQQRREIVAMTLADDLWLQQMWAGRA